MTDTYEKVANNLKDANQVDLSLLSAVDDPKAMVKHISTRSLTLDHWRKLILALYEADMAIMFHDVAQHILNNEIDKKSSSKAEDVEKEKKLILIINIAVYYLIQASKVLEKSKRDELFGEVMKCTSKSDTIDMMQSSLFVFKGYFLFHQGMFDQAVNYFDNGRDIQKQCVTAYIGQACVEFCKKEYSKALKLLKSAFRFNPKAPAKLKIALGYCFYILNKTKLALKAFEYALETEPNNPEAYLGIAIVNKKRKNFPAYFENLEKSFSIKKDNVSVLLELAEHFFYKEDFAKAKKLSLHGLKLLNKSPTIVMEKSKLNALKVDYYEIKSRLNHIVASCYHHSQNYENALKHYNIAVGLYSNNFQAQFGLGQIHINDRNFSEALTCFEYIVKNCNDLEVGECYRMLGYLYSKKSAKEEAIQYYEKAIKFDNKDYECILEYASYLEPIDPDKALLLYLNAVKIINAINAANAQNQENGHKEIFIHPEILLNIAVLRHKKGDFDKSLEELRNVLKLVEGFCEDITNEKNDKYRAMRVTIMYDLAIVLEERGIVFEAMDLYNQILNENPLYLDAYLRLGFLALSQGQKKRAEELCHQFMEKTDTVIKATRNDRLKQRFVDGLCLQGYSLNEAGSYNKALSAYSKVRDKYVFDDPYAKLSQAAIFYTMSLEHRDNPGDQKKYLSKIMDIARNVLLTDEPNFFAAMIMGVTLAETNRLAEAKDVFNLLLESCSHNKNIMLNLAHLEIINRRYDIAIATFNKYLKEKSTVCDPHTEMSLALCYLMTRRYKEAKRVVQKLVLKYPENLAYRYNLCAIYYEEAFEMLKQEQRSIENAKQGVKYLKIIQSQFDYLMTSQKAKLSRSVIEDGNERKAMREKEFDRIRELSNDKSYWISTNFDTFMDRLKQDELNQKKKEQHVVEEKKKRNFKEEKEREKAKQLELARQKERELEEKAMRMMREAQDAKDKHIAEREEKERAKRERAQKRDKDLMTGDGGKKKRRSKADDGDGFIEQDEEEGPNEYELDDDEEEEPYGYEGNEEEEGDERRRRKKEKKEKRRHKEKKGRDRGGDEEDEGPIMYTEEEEPKPQKKRKLQKLGRRNNEDENMFNSDNENEDQAEEEKKSEEIVEEDMGKGSEAGDIEEPAVERDDEGENEEQGEGGYEEERPKSQGDEEEHYL